VGVLYLQPAVPVVFVDAELSVRRNAFKVAGANFHEEALPGLLDVLSVEQT
jgi:hypothetical protein